MIKDNTLLGLDLFDFKKSDTYILHIPHSSTNIPILDFYDVNKIESEINKLTDWETHRIFDVPNLTKLIPNFSRIFCDVERFSDDELEPMFKFGRGFYYTKTDSSEYLRENNIDHKNRVLNDYYLPHHNRLDEMVDEKLSLYGTCTIIDCHSFSDEPFNTDLDKSKNRPDVCIGIDSFHTPKHLVDQFTNYFKNIGYDVKINSPYSGTMVNNKSYLKDKRVNSIMIEFNRKLYMTENYEIINEKVELLNKQICDLLK